MTNPTSTPLTCFKAYDIRGKLGDEFNEKIAYQIGRSTSEYLNAKSVVIGFDARATSKSIASSVSLGVRDSGANSYSIGLSGTEEMYWAVANYGFSAGIIITASHNPIDYNGMKIVKHGSKPLENNEFLAIKKIAEEGVFLNQNKEGKSFDVAHESRETYLKKILSFVDLKSLEPVKIVINVGNGAAGPTLKALISLLDESQVQTNIICANEKPDPTFPHGIPNPLLAENQRMTSEIVQREKADFGIAFDGDFDRCFFFDEQGAFIEGEYMVGLLAECFLSKYEGASIVYDPRVVWNVVNKIKSAGGCAVLSKTGHTNIKQTMRNNNAVYGGELSAHHYFKDFAYCDSGMIPWLLVWELVSKRKQSLKEIIDISRGHFLSSGELNFKVQDPDACIKLIKKNYGRIALSIDEIDGFSAVFKDWRFNLRKSNTEPLIRINVETIENSFLLRKKIDELIEFINKF